MESSNGEIISWLFPVDDTGQKEMYIACSHIQLTRTLGRSLPSPLLPTLIKWISAVRCLAHEGLEREQD